MNNLLGRLHWRLSSCPNLIWPHRGSRWRTTRLAKNPNGLNTNYNCFENGDPDGGPKKVFQSNVSIFVFWQRDGRPFSGKPCMEACHKSPKEMQCTSTKCWVQSFNEEFKMIWNRSSGRTGQENCLKRRINILVWDIQMGGHVLFQSGGPTSRINAPQRNFQSRPPTCT